MVKRKKRDKLSTVLAVVLCLPILAIAILLISYYTGSIALDNISKVTIKVSEDSKTVLDSQEDIEFFGSFLEGATAIDTAMRDVTGEAPVYIIFEDDGKNYEYKFYPSLDLAGCLLVGPEGDLYVPDVDTAKDLLLRSEFDYLYADRFLPTLSVLSGEKVYDITPSESDWNYYKSDGNIYKYTQNNTETEQEDIVILKGLENRLRFTPGNEVRPYSMKMKCVSASGTEYENLKDISELNLSVDTVLNITLSVEWSSMNGAQAFGTAKYSFQLIYDIPAVITIPETEFKVGDIIRIDASDLSEHELIQLETMLKTNNIDFDVITDSKGVALLAIDVSNSAPAEYNLNINTEVGSISESISVSPVETLAFVSIPEISEDVYYQTVSLDKMQEFYSTLENLTSARPKTNRFVFGTDKFVSPVGNIEATYGFGQKIKIHNNYDIHDLGNHTCTGMVYELAEGTDIHAAQSGEIVFNGTLGPTGNTVILYHGYGIYTYYFHLNSVKEDMIVGTTVSANQIIGTAGTTGFTNNKTVLHYAASIDGVFVNPEALK